MYCTVQQAREAGTTGTDSEVAAWIAAATERITAYTLQLFEPTVLAVVADVAPDGLVILPRRVRTVTAVTPVGVDDAPSLPSSAYRVSSSSVLGAIDSVRLAWGGYDDLVVGAESWNGGWRGLFEQYWTAQVQVTGSFGYDTVPALVEQACALLAAHVQADARPSDADAAQDDSLDVDDEGNNVRITDDAPTTAVTPRSSTGSTQADALLATYLNAGPMLIGGV
ncbi:hypothetical protein [Streptomyces sp. RKAG337]|uniref:hypothetical protein n=1 Tax=Streptomyces sp. RKAG337 TaxID=2893404 RepID=UPI0020342950|nr:hypothetical protein [Streptomyces sp. RKAG337]MCM2427383.1 hypothetical protein [Streptomyces sp. RKAG337]